VLTDARIPERAILDHLAEPLGEWVAFGSPAPGGWQAGTVRGGRPDVVDLDTVRLLKQHRLPSRRCVVYATYTVVKSLHPRPAYTAHAVIEASPSADGWRAGAVCSGGGGEPRWTQPTVNLGGRGWPSRFCAGGTVHGVGHEVARVRLCFANGVELDDDAGDGVVLFATDDHVQPPATAVLLDPSGAELRVHEAIPGD
jgi:hypothetical protein